MLKRTGMCAKCAGMRWNENEGKSQCENQKRGINAPFSRDFINLLIEYQDDLLVYGVFQTLACFKFRLG